jgi:hypothetical protein
MSDPNFLYSDRIVQRNAEGTANTANVLASNVSTTAVLNTFPTTSTGTSLGHYHFTESGTNALKFLNVAGTGLGGHKFYTSNSTTAPVNTATIGLDGLTIDTGIPGGVVLTNLPPIIVGQPTQVIFTYPPGLDSFGIQFGVYTNPVQVLFNSGPFVTGVTYYAQATNAQTLRIRLTPNPLDPEMDCSSFTYGQVAFAYVTSNTPGTTQITNLSTSLTFETDTTYSALFNDSVVVQDITNNRQALTYAYQSVYQDNSTGKSTAILAPLVTNANQVFNASTPTSSVIIKVDTPSITTTNNTDESVLTATALTFNNINVKMNQFTSTLIYSSPIIYADGHEPATSLTIRNSFGYSGWFFKNVILGQKINWYFPAKTPTTTPVSALKGISISFFNGVTNSNDNTLFITIYTVPTGSGDYFPGFFHSSMTYVFDQTVTPIANTNYQGVCILDINDVPFNYETQIQYEESTVNNPRGTYLPTDNILAVVIGTNSASPVNSVELVVNKFNLHYADFTQSYLLIPP